MKRALLIGYVWPEPNSSAAGARVVQLLEALVAGGVQTHFACAASQTTHQLDLSTLGVTSHSVALNFSEFDQWVAQLSPDLVIFDRFVTEEQFGWRVAGSCPKALRVLDTEDLHSLRAAREALLKDQLRVQKSSGPVLAGPPALYATMRQSDLVLREVAAILRCDLSLMISQYEIQLLCEQCSVPGHMLYHLPFMVTPELRKTPGFDEREHFVTIGNFRHGPNWDAVLWLKQQLWPLLRRRTPGAELHIYGAYPPKKATQLHAPREGFMVKGWADDALAVIAGARVLLAPLRFGAGIKGKLVDALITQTPSVATSIASESMYGDLPWPGRVADDAEGFADAAATLYRDREAWQGAAQQCQPLLTRRYNARDLGDDWLATLRAHHQNLEAWRRDNFLAAMFQYHSARSTEFMSRWIEVKNRLQNS